MDVLFQTSLACFLSVFKNGVKGNQNPRNSLFSDLHQMYLKSRGHFSVLLGRRPTDPLKFPLLPSVSVKKLLCSKFNAAELVSEAHCNYILKGTYSPSCSQLRISQRTYVWYMHTNTEHSSTSMAQTSQPQACPIRRLSVRAWGSAASVL